MGTNAVGSPLWRHVVLFGAMSRSSGPAAPTSQYRAEQVQCRLLPVLPQCILMVLRRSALPASRFLPLGFFDTVAENTSNDILPPKKNTPTLVPPGRTEDVRFVGLPRSNVAESPHINVPCPCDPPMWPVTIHFTKLLRPSQTESQWQPPP